MTKLRILCFGDSLTEGYTHSDSWDIIFHPYGVSLAASLRDGMPNIQFDVDIEGLSVKHHTYDWVILLGGTNDLGAGFRGLDAPDIFAGLQAVGDVALAHGAKILIMTVPEIASFNRDLEQRRNILNSLIRAHCDDSRIYLFDLFQKIPYHSLPFHERKKIWDDGVHFTAQGYDTLGAYLADRLIQIISASPNMAPKDISNPEGFVYRTEKDSGHGLEFERFVSASDDDPDEKEYHGEIRENDSDRETLTCGLCVIQ